MRYKLLLIAAAATLAGCGGPPDDGPADVLTGTVTLDGQPAEYIMVVFAGPDGREVSGPRRPDGRYRVESPPKGLLKVKFAAGPPVPGLAPAKAATGNIPAKYLTTKNELQFDYAGGRKTYDITLQP